MSTRSIVFAIAVLAGGLFSSGASAVEGMTTADALMRVGPGDGFAEIGTIKAGSALKIHSCQDSRAWCLVRLDGRSGWVPSVLVKAGGFSKAQRSYFDPDARPSVGFYGYDYGFFGNGVSGAHRFRTPSTRRFGRSRLSGRQLSRDFRIDRRYLSDKHLPRDFRFDRRPLSDKQLPRDFRSTIHSPGFRLHKQGFPRFTGD